MKKTTQTKENIFDAFWKLYTQKRIEKITVSEICKLAGYNRSTFYEYFNDIYDLLTQYEDTLLIGIKNQIKEIQSDFTNDITYNNKIFLNLFTILGDKVWFLLGPNGDPMFKQKMQNETKHLLPLITNLEEDINNIDYIQHFVISTILSMIAFWNIRNKDIDIQELLSLTQSLIKNGVSDILLKKNI